jgi:hypothetical protein
VLDSDDEHCVVLFVDRVHDAVSTPAGRAVALELAAKWPTDAVRLRDEWPDEELDNCRRSTFREPAERALRTGGRPAAPSASTTQVLRFELLGANEATGVELGACLTDLVERPGRREELERLLERCEILRAQDQSYEMNSSRLPSGSRK